MTLSHEGEILVFAKDAELLRPYVRFFKLKHLAVHLWPQPVKIVTLKLSHTNEVEYGIMPVS